MDWFTQRLTEHCIDHQQQAQGHCKISDTCVLPVIIHSGGSALAKV